VSAPGEYRIAVRYSPYWHSTHGCVLQGGDGMVRLQAPAAGTFRIEFRVSLPSLLDAIAPVEGRGVCV
jgi:hypothetical protein